EGGQYQMVDYHVLSIDSLSGTATDHGLALALEDIPWASQQLWAPDAAYKDGTYYFYFPAKDKDGIFRIGVATSEDPAGPFAAEESYIEGSFSMDPCVFMENDGTAYMIFGGLDGGQLEDWQTGEYVKDSAGPGKDEAALGPMIVKMSGDMLSFAEEPQEIAIVDENGEAIAADDEMRRFFEAAWVHQYDGKYYLSYSTGTTHYLVYAVSDNIEGPYVYRGQILTPVQGWTTHHSIVEFEGEWYLFYHDAFLSGGIDYRRCVKYTKLDYNADGTILTIDPYEED
ncbi:MAG: family 43 glycosylhydrolase, partial [Eubacteriales bacterium]